MSELKYWAVLFMQNGEGSGTVAVTDGERTPHDTATVLRITKTRYGAVQRFGAVGPFATTELAHKYLTDAVSTPEGLNHWVDRLEFVDSRTREAKLSEHDWV